MLIISVKEFDSNRTTKIHCSMHVGHFPVLTQPLCNEHALTWELYHWSSTFSLSLATSHQLTPQLSRMLAPTWTYVSHLVFLLPNALNSHFKLTLTLLPKPGGKFLSIEISCFPKLESWLLLPPNWKSNFGTKLCAFYVTVSKKFLQRFFNVPSSCITASHKTIRSCSHKLNMAHASQQQAASVSVMQAR